MIRFENVTATYENGSGIFDVTFEVKESELLFLMGPTGSGKSTLLKTIYKDINIDNGALYVDNQEISKIEKSKIPFLRRNIGMIFQDFKLLSDRTVFENIALPLQIEGLNSNDVREKVFDVLDAVQLSGKEQRFPLELSGGEQQRVAIARAIVKEPKVLLADEPTGNLDPNISMEILELLDMATESGASVIMCTHNYPLIKYKKRNFLELSEGKIR
tara:strand:- start:3096 stop:3743 length:648 start_codon:yes stop_codon:yes gene_type:complete